MALESDGHSSQQPFPSFDINEFVDGLEDLLDSASTASASVPATTAASVTNTASNPPATQAVEGEIEFGLIAVMFTLCMLTIHRSSSHQFITTR